MVLYFYMTHLIKNKQEFIKSCFPSIVGPRDTFDLSEVGNIFRIIDRGYLDSGIINQLIMGYINNDSSVFYESKTSKILLLTEKDITKEIDLEKLLIDAIAPEWGRMF